MLAIYLLITRWVWNELSIIWGIGVHLTQANVNDGNRWESNAPGVPCKRSAERVVPLPMSACPEVSRAGPAQGAVISCKMYTERKTGTTSNWWSFVNNSNYSICNMIIQIIKKNILCYVSDVLKIHINMGKTLHNDVQSKCYVNMQNHCRSTTWNCWQWICMIWCTNMQNNTDYIICVLTLKCKICKPWAWHEVC